MAPSTSKGLIWRTAGGDGTRRGLFDGAVAIGNRPAERLLAQGALQASAVFDTNQRVFVADMDGGVQAFSTSGDLLWRTKLTAGISSTPAVHPVKPALFIGTHAGRAYALETTKGAVLWEREIPTQADPRILSDLLFWPQANAVVLSSWGGRFHALDAESGKGRFSWDAGLWPRAAASASRDGLIYFQRAISNRGIEFVCISAESEEAVLHLAPEEKRGARRTMVAGAPVLDDARGLAYFVVNRDQGSVLHAWSLPSNRILWKCSLPASVQATPALRKDGTILLPDLAGSVHGISSDGHLQFSYASGCEYLLAGAVSESEGTSFVGDPCGVLHAIDARGSGRRIHETRRAIQARPSFDPAGNLYVPSTDKALHVFRARNESQER